MATLDQCLKARECVKQNYCSEKVYECYKIADPDACYDKLLVDPDFYSICVRLYDQEYCDGLLEDTCRFMCNDNNDCYQACINTASLPCPEKKKRKK
mgnify:FL=1